MVAAAAAETVAMAMTMLSLPHGRLEVGLLCRHAVLSLYGVGWSPEVPTPGMQSFDRVYSAVQKAVAN